MVSLPESFGRVDGREHPHNMIARIAREMAIEECAKVVEQYGLERMNDAKDYPATIAAACCYRIRALVSTASKP